MKISNILIATALIAGAASTQVHACGDSLYRVGTGVSYRVYTAPLPGSVLVYGESEGAEQLAEALAQSGHGVRLVSSQAELDTEMQTGNYDVVIAAYSEHDAIEASTSAAPQSHTTFLPVAVSDEEEAVAKQQYERVMMADKDEIKNYLKAIHKTLKAKT